MTAVKKRPAECGKVTSSMGVRSMPRPTARMAERKSPKPSMERTAASSNPDG